MLFPNIFTALYNGENVRRIFEYAKMVDLLYHHAKFDGAGTSLAADNFDMFCFSLFTGSMGKAHTSVFRLLIGTILSFCRPVDVAHCADGDEMLHESVELGCTLF